MKIYDCIVIDVLDGKIILDEKIDTFKLHGYFIEYRNITEDTVDRKWVYVHAERDEGQVKKGFKFQEKLKLVRYLENKELVEQWTDISLLM